MGFFLIFQKKYSIAINSKGGLLTYFLKVKNNITIKGLEYTIQKIGVRLSPQRH